MTTTSKLKVLHEFIICFIGMKQSLKKGVRDIDEENRDVKEA